MASTLPDAGFPLPAFTNDRACSASFSASPGKGGLEDSIHEQAFREVTARPLTLGLKQRFQFIQFSTVSRKLVLQKVLGATFDIKLCLRRFVSRMPMARTKGTHFAHGVVVAGAGLKSPISRGVEGTEIVFDEQFLILLWVNRAYRGVDGRDLVLQRIVMSQLERLRQMEHGRDVGDVVGLEVFCIASVANHRLAKIP